MVRRARSLRGYGVVGALALGVLGCFHGEFLVGDPCRSDVECGPELSCIDGLCDGLIPPRIPVLTVEYAQVKQFVFSWEPQPEAQYFQLLERLGPEQDWAPLGGDIPPERTTASFTMPLHFRVGASYALRVCNELGCAESVPVAVDEATLGGAIGYAKASNTDADDLFGASIALSADGNTLAVGAPLEDAAASGVDGPQGNNLGDESGAVYVYGRDDEVGWVQQAYLKAFDFEFIAFFGASVALSADGNTLAVGAVLQENDGAAYVFVRDELGAWSEQAQLGASNAQVDDTFGVSVALSADGNTLAVGAVNEDGGVGGIDGDPNEAGAVDSGAVYAFVRDGTGGWSQQAYIKASVPGDEDNFGLTVALSADGDTLAVGAPGESSSATGIDGDPDDDSVAASGAAYVFVRDGDDRWSEQAYIKAASADPCDLFGTRIALSADGDTLAVGAHGDDRPTGCLPERDDLQPGPGAVHLFVRDANSTWSQAARIQPAIIDDGDNFGGGIQESSGTALALSERGDILVIGALGEDGGGQGLAADPTDDSASDSGAVFVFQRDEQTPWSQRAYLKAPNGAEEDGFGYGVALSADGTTLAVSAPREDSRASGIGDPLADQASDAATDAGAVYLY